MSGTALAERLRVETRDLHTEVERAGVMADLLRGRIEHAAYCALLRNLHAIYAALEGALAACRADPVLAHWQAPALRREAALAADLETLQGGDWRAAIAVAPAAAEYAQRLQALAAAGSRALVAHAYVRYLGDLAGGQVLQRLVAGRFGAAGTRFYDFGGEALGLRDALRAALAAQAPAPEEAELIIAEACWAFRQHRLLFEQLKG